MLKIIFLVFFIIVILIFVRLLILPQNSKNSQISQLQSFSPTKPSKNDKLQSVHFWAYQIQKQDQNNNIEMLANSHYDLLVIDNIRSVRGQENYNNKADVQLLKNSKNSTGGKKIVLSYIDVGEAERYRFYWKEGWQIGNPNWIVAADPDGWRDNYPVKFWKDEWRVIMKNYLDKIISDGYDGIYLDWLEAYSFEPVAQAAKQENLSPDQELIKYVTWLSRYVKTKNSNFIIIAQNAAEMGKFPEYRAIFDGIAQEEVWYRWTGDPDKAEQPGDISVEPDRTQELLANLRIWQDSGKSVFTVEYTQKGEDVKRAYDLAKQHGFITYTSLVLLDSLTKTPPPGY